ncbi:MAG: response regulator [Terrimicrobiaceae bacterium]|nr:response regulator [Terrimicrobiaceae bacterium]
MIPEGSTSESAKPEAEWLLVGDFLFYLRLLARQFSSLARETGAPRKNMTIVPDSGMAAAQLEERDFEALILDCAEPGEQTLEFIRSVRARHSSVRLILVSAGLKREVEARLMEAGAHLCFSKPRTPDEAGSMYRLISAIADSDGFCPDGVFKGLAPARFVQYLCSKGESGRMALATPDGEAELIIERGRIVDASLGSLNGDDAASMILSFERTERCHFRRLMSSQFHTVRLDTHQLWRNAEKPVLPVEPAPPKLQAPRPLAKRLQDTFDALAALDGVSVEFHLDRSSA